MLDCNPRVLGLFLAFRIVPCFILTPLTVGFKRDQQARMQ